jgi:hypothetical protein
MACFKDPGIIPASGVQSRVDTAQPGFKQHVVEVLKKEGEANTAYQQSYEERRYNEGKYCRTCTMTRPALSTHCSQCNHCVSMWDHHCNWIGNCVGARNHREFVYFLIFTSLLLWTVVGTLIWNLFFYRLGSASNFITVSLLIVLLCVGVFVTPMCRLHLELVALGQTLKMTERQGRMHLNKSLWWKLNIFMMFTFRYGQRESIVPTTLRVHGEHVETHRKLYS